ncbi:MAG: DNA polymerase III subunit delta, partial [Traorella sp.]
QPVVYRILENALLSHSYAHAYLFVGEKGTGKLDTAFLFAQSLICEQEGFACEKCSTCERIKHNNFADMIFIDGTETSIKKKDILHIQDQFSKTSIEVTSKKIYILNLIENATLDALNSLLKFIEEPVNDVIAILICEQIDKILPTIISRCQRIPFKKISIQDSLNYAKELDINSLDAYICANLVNNLTQIQPLSEDENYQNARIWAMSVIENFINDPYMTLVNIQKEGFNDKKGNDRLQFQYFVDILILFFRSCIMQENLCQSETWKQAKQKYTSKQCIQLLNKCIEAKNKYTKSISVKLLVDSMLIQMKEVL